MNKFAFNWRFIAASMLLVAGYAANADTRVVQVWTCTLNDGKSLEDLNAVHGNWLAWANSQSYGGDIRGLVAAPIVSDDLSVVLLIDSYPDFETFAADSVAYFNSDEGQALEAAYSAVGPCTSNIVYSITDSGSD